MRLFVLWKRFTSSLAGIIFDSLIHSLPERATTFPFNDITGFFADSNAAAATLSASSAYGIVLSPIK